MTATATTATAFDRVLAPIIERIQQDLETWVATGKYEHSWVSSAPRNIETGKPYRGVNIFRLILEGKSSPIWGTYLQWQKAGYQVRKNEGKGKLGVEIYSPFLSGFKKDEHDNDKIIPVVRAPRTYHVFNSDDVFNIETGEPFDFTPPNPAEAIEHAETFFQALDLKIRPSHIAGYAHRPDIVLLPPRENFKSNEAYYSTFAHEVIHWTAHVDRVNRPLENYSKDILVRAKEELVAEFGSALVCGYLGIYTDEIHHDTTDYLGDWNTAFKDDPTALTDAIRQSITAFDFLVAQQ